jgi:hypothetical protein
MEVAAWQRRLEHTWKVVDDGKGNGVMSKSGGREILAVGACSGRLNGKVGEKSACFR